MTDDKVDQIFDSFEGKLSKGNEYEVELENEEVKLVRIYSDVDVVYIRRSDYELLKELFND